MLPNDPRDDDGRLIGPDGEPVDPADDPASGFYGAAPTDVTTTPEDDAPTDGGKPKVTASKQAWEDYAASPAVGMDRAEAESMTRPKLIAEVNRREAEQP